MGLRGFLGNIFYSGLVIIGVDSRLTLVERGNTMISCKYLVEQMAKAVVDLPDQVQVKEVSGEKVTIFELRVAPSNTGQVIGKAGRIANSFRTILGAIGAKECQCIKLEILE